MDLQFHLEAFEFMMIFSYVNKKVEHASSPPTFLLCLTIPKRQHKKSNRNKSQKGFLKENKCM